MISTYVDHNLRHHDDLVGEYPGVCDAVRNLHRAGYRLGVVTSKLHGALERGLTMGGYDGLFEVLIGADDVENPKPHAEPVLRAIEQLKVEPEATIFVGDSPHDMASGHAVVCVPPPLFGDRSRVRLSNLTSRTTGWKNLAISNDCYLFPTKSGPSIQKDCSVFVGRDTRVTSDLLTR